jgi:general secretion pathway protein A
MYLDFFGLKEKPFSQTPDPRFLYWNDSYREALASLRYGIQERKGFLTFIGEAGTGKTTLLRKLLEELGPDVLSVFLFNPDVGFEEILQYTLGELGISCPSQRRLDMLQRLNEFLLAAYAEGRNTVLLIDEAQDLDSDVLESLRLLSNLETSRDKILQIVLCGQPELARRLAQPNLRQLKQRIAVRCRLEPLRRGEIPDYIAARMQFAGATEQVFDDGCIPAIWTFSGGIPRLVNMACDNALLVGYALGKRRVDATVLDEVVHDLGRLDILELSDDFVDEPPRAPLGNPSTVLQRRAESAPTPVPRSAPSHSAALPGEAKTSPPPNETARTVAAVATSGIGRWLPWAILGGVLLGVMLSNLVGRSSRTTEGAGVGRPYAESQWPEALPPGLPTFAPTARPRATDASPAAAVTPSTVPGLNEPDTAIVAPVPTAGPLPTVAATLQTASPDGLRIGTGEPGLAVGPTGAPRADEERTVGAPEPHPTGESSGVGPSPTPLADGGSGRATPTEQAAFQLLGPVENRRAIVRRGDTLSNLAEAFYRSKSLTMLDVLGGANPGLRDLDHIEPDQVLVLPEPLAESRIFATADGPAVLVTTTRDRAAAERIRGELPVGLQGRVTVEPGRIGSLRVYRIIARDLGDQVAAQRAATALGPILGPNEREPIR